jgi:hypothetical protein
MKGRSIRQVQLNLGLAAPPPATISGEKDEELVLALVDLLMDAIAIIDAPARGPEPSDER